MTTAAAANIGDPLGHPGFVRGEEEVGDGRYESDSDDDDDVDRYVFLARQPAAPAKASDDGDDAMHGGRGGGGGCGRKRHLSEILAHAPPAAKKARLHLAPPRGVFEVEEESGSDGTVRSPERFRGDLDRGRKTKKRRRSGGEPQVQRAVRGKRSSGADREASRHRDVTAGQKTSVAAAEAEGPRRFPCSICGRCFGSYQALGGHVHLGHMKKAKNGIAVASHEDVAGGSNGDRDMAAVEAADGGAEKSAVAAIAQESDGDGKKALHAAACHQDVDRSSGDSNEEKFIGAAEHGDHRGDGNVEGEKVTAATGHDGADGSGNGTERKVAGAGNGNSIVGKTQYSCRVCGKEYLSGKALGGHMRKHRKLSPHNGSKERGSPEVDDGAGHGQEKTAVAASSGESDGDGKKTLSAAACHRDVDSSSGDSNGNEEMFTGAADHDDHRGDGNGTERKKVAIGRCHELATGSIGNANSDVHKTQHRCELCGKEYLSGQALGGHMRMHRKRSPDDGGKDQRSPEADGITNQRAVVITGNSRLRETTNPQHGTHFDGRMIGWL